MQEQPQKRFERRAASMPPKEDEIETHDTNDANEAQLFAQNTKHEVGVRLVNRNVFGDFPSPSPCQEPLPKLISACRMWYDTFN